MDPDTAGQGSNQDKIAAAMEERFRREDERWSFANQVRDWIIFAVIAVLWAAWMLAIFLIEPGIR